MREIPLFKSHYTNTLVDNMYRCIPFIDPYTKYIMNWFFCSGLNVPVRMIQRHMEFILVKQRFNKL